MRDREDEFRAAGTDLVAIGMGVPEQAADFREKQGIAFPLLVDRTRETYREMGLSEGSIMDVAGPRVWAKAAKAALKGNAATVAKQNWVQLGGVAVIEPGGKVSYLHRATKSSDNPPVDEVLAHLS